MTWMKPTLAAWISSRSYRENHARLSDGWYGCAWERAQEMVNKGPYPYATAPEAEPKDDQPDCKDCAAFVGPRVRRIRTRLIEVE